MKNLILTEKEILEEELIIENAKKDASLFKPLYEKYFIQIFRFIYNKIDNKQISADITSQVFLKALQNISKYQHKNLPFSAWLYKIAYNEVMQYFRKTKKEQIIIISEDLIVNLAEDTETIDAELLNMKLEAVLEKLEHQELEIIQLRFHEGLSFKELGHILNISENYAKVKTYRLLEKIKKKISQGR